MGGKAVWRTASGKEETIEMRKASSMGSSPRGGRSPIGPAQQAWRNRRKAQRDKYEEGMGLMGEEGDK